MSANQTRRTSRARRPASARPTGNLATMPPSDLRSVIEGHIIPKLMLAHTQASARPTARSSEPKSITSAECDLPALASLLAANDVKAARKVIDGLRAQGAGETSLLLDVVSPVAQYFGEMWLSDDYSFTQVTIGLGALQTLVREISAETGGAIPATLSNAPRIRLFAAAPEQHTLGVLVVEEFFRLAGWEACGGQPQSRQLLLADAAERWYDAIGISVSVRQHCRDVPSLVGELRTASCNPAVIVIAGGVGLSADDSAARLGVDAIAGDGPQAVKLADELVGPVRRPSYA